MAYDPETRLLEVWLSGQMIAAFTSTYIVLPDTYQFLLGRNAASTQFMHADVRGAFVAYAKADISDFLAMYHAGYDRALEHEVMDDRLAHYTFDDVVLGGIDGDDAFVLHGEMGNVHGAALGSSHMKSVPSR
jgi:hypothetical protein